MDSETPISLHDANRILPELRGKVGKLVRIYKKLKKISVYQKDALDSVKTTGSAPVHPVYFRFLENLHSSLQDVTTLGCEVKAVVTILDRQAGGAAAFAELGLPFYSLFVADSEGRLTIGRLPEALSSAAL